MMKEAKHVTNSNDLRAMIAHSHQHLLEIKQTQEAQGILLRRIFHKVGKLMSTADDIKAALADISAETTAETDLLTAIDTKMQGLSDQITALQKQIDDLTAAGGGGLSAQDVSDIQASIAEIKKGTDAVKTKLEITAGTGAAPASPAG